MHHLEVCENLFFVQRGWLNGNHPVFNGRRKVLIDTAYAGDLDQTQDLIEATRKCREKLNHLMEDPVRLGNDHLKKILVFVLLMKRGCRKDRLYEYLAGSDLFPAVVDRSFRGRYRNR